MAAKVKKAKGAAKTAKVVTVADIAEEFGIEPRKVRMIARSLGMKAPETNVEGFGPKAKYEWEEGSKELKTLREALQQAADQPRPTKAAKNRKKVEAEAVESEDDELEEELEDEELEDDELDGEEDEED